MRGLAARYCMNLRRAAREFIGSPGEVGQAPLCRALRGLSWMRLRPRLRKPGAVLSIQTWAMDPHLNPFSVLSWIIAPALLTNACTLLILSTANRLARAVDRTQELSSKLEDGADPASPVAIRRRGELAAHEQRSFMLLAALRSYYVACGSFAT